MPDTRHPSPWVPGSDHARAPWDRLHLRDLLERAPAERGKTVLVMGEQRLTYGHLATRADRVAGNLAHKFAVGRGDRVAVSCRNRVEYFEIETGIGSLGAIMVALSWRYAAQERIDLLARSGAKVAIVDSDLASPIEAAWMAGRLPQLQSLVTFDPAAPGGRTYAELLTEGPASPLEDRGLADPHEIIFTSGTTGTPKGAVWSTGAVVWNAIQQAMDYRITSQSSTYVAFDLNYIGGRHQFVWAVLQQGGTVHLKESGGFDPVAVLDYVTRHRISHVLWVPTMLYDVLATQAVGNTDTSGLQMIMCGGSPLSGDLLRRATAAFHSTDVVQVFGLTEGGGTVSFVPGDRLADKIGSAGRASLHNRLRVVDEAGHPCDPGATGEIQVQGPTMTLGYWDDPEATDALFSDGWLNTGDLGHLDKDGYLTISGRRKELIISGGMNIFPSEVEDVLTRHPAVRAAAVIGLPDDRWGEVVCAVVEPEPGMDPTPDDLVAHCREHLAGHKKPRVVHVVPELPRTMSGKVRKQALREELFGPSRP